MKLFKSTLVIIGLLLLTVSCRPLLTVSCQTPKPSKEYKVGYLHLDVLYQAEPQFRILDSISNTISRFR